jgi:hypothetical protein
MKKYHIFPIVIILIMLLLNFNAIYADEVNITSSSGSLSQSIADVPDRGSRTINLENGTYLYNGYNYGHNSEIFINNNKNITIVGKGSNTIINGEYLHWGFNVDEYSSLTLINIKIINMNSLTDGAAIYNQGTLNVISCDLAYNNAVGNGGAIYTKLSKVNISSSKFDSNDAALGSSIYIENNMNEHEQHHNFDTLVYVNYNVFSKKTNSFDVYVNNSEYNNPRINADSNWWGENDIENNHINIHTNNHYSMEFAYNGLTNNINCSCSDFPCGYCNGECCVEHFLAKNPDVTFNETLMQYSLNLNDTSAENNKSLLPLFSVSLEVKGLDPVSKRQFTYYETFDAREDKLFSTIARIDSYSLRTSGANYKYIDAVIKDIIKKAIENAISTSPTETNNNENENLAVINLNKDKEDKKEDIQNNESSIIPIINNNENNTNGNGFVNTGNNSNPLNNNPQGFTNRDNNSSNHNQDSVNNINNINKDINLVQTSIDINNRPNTDNSTLTAGINGKNGFGKSVSSSASSGKIYEVAKEVLSSLSNESNYSYLAIVVLSVLIGIGYLSRKFYLKKLI